MYKIWCSPGPVNVQQPNMVLISNVWLAYTLVLLSRECHAYSAGQGWYPLLYLPSLDICTYLIQIHIHIYIHIYMYYRNMERYQDSGNNKLVSTCHVTMFFSKVFTSKINISLEQGPFWKGTFIFQPSIFRGYVIFRWKFHSNSDFSGSPTEIGKRSNWWGIKPEAEVLHCRFIKSKLRGVCHSHFLLSTWILGRMASFQIWGTCVCFSLKRAGSRSRLVFVPGHQIIQKVFLCQAVVDGTSAYPKSSSALHLADGWQGVVRQYVAAKWQADLRLDDVMS